MTRISPVEPGKAGVGFNRFLDFAFGCARNDNAGTRLRCAPFDRLRTLRRGKGLLTEVVVLCNGFCDVPGAFEAVGEDNVIARAESYRIFAIHNGYFAFN